MKYKGLNREIAKEILKLKEDGYLYHRESQYLEFKENFTLASLADYFRDFAAFANNSGGYLVHGVKDKPKRELKGLGKNAAQRFDEIDPEKITGHLLETFANKIDWEYEIYIINRRKFGFFYIHKAIKKPIISKKDYKDLKNGEIYFRYGGRTQKIQHAELESIIEERIEQQNNNWLDLVKKIGIAGPENAAVLDTEKGIIGKNDKQILVVGEDLIKDFQIIKEGEFNEKDGAKTLKLVGEVQSTDKIEIIKKIKENKLKEYPLSSRELWKKVKLKTPDIKQNEFYEIIKENDLKHNQEYCGHIFRNNTMQEQYKNDKILPNGVPCIYRESAIDFISNIYINQKKDNLKED
jgi:hypothetical protein